MKMNSSKLLFLMTMLMTTMMTFSSNNLLFSWMSMEINLISFIPILSQSKKMKDETMKYLIIQSSASSIMLMAMLMNSVLETPLEKSIILMVGLLMKMGLMPMHLWLPLMMTKMSWKNCLILTTWQKIIPMIMTSQMIKMKMIIIPMTVSLIFSPISGMKQLSTKKMMSYSSISNSPWMISSIFLSKQQFIYFMSIYSMINMTIMTMMNKMNINYMNQLKKMNKSQKLNLIVSMLSISGMPPMLGFFPKWMIIQLMVMKSMFLATMMILSSMISMFMYMKIISTVIMNMSMKKKLFSMKTNLTFLMINLMGIPMMMFMKIN